jgi:hypothetical protein
MAQKNKIKKAKKGVELRKRGGIPAWLYMTLSFVIPPYGFIYYFMIKEKDSSRAKIALFFAFIGVLVYLFFKMLVWFR